MIADESARVAAQARNFGFDERARFGRVLGRGVHLVVPYVGAFRAFASGAIIAIGV
jgi:hypothetical protein